MDRIQVLLADPHQLSREGLKRMLEGETYNIVGVARSLDDARDQIEKGLRPNLLVSAFGEAASPDQYAVIQHIRTNFADLRIIIIANNISPTLLSQALSAGVGAYLLRDMSTEALTRSLHLVMLGQQVFPTQATMWLLGVHGHARPAAGNGQTLEEQLRPRGVSECEGQILRILLNGYSNKMIARKLGITEATVKARLKALMRKVNAQNRTQAAIWGVANGFGEEAPAANASLSS